MEYRLADLKISSTASGVSAEVSISCDGAELEPDVAIAPTPNEAVFAAIARVMKKGVRFEIISSSVIAKRLGLPYLAQMVLGVSGHDSVVLGNGEGENRDYAEYAAFIEAIASLLPQQ